MKNRLDYQTVGGNVSEDLTFLQLLEHLRMAQEACLTLGHLRKAQDDMMLGQGFLAVGEMLKLTIGNVTKLATNKGRLTSGWRS